MHEDIAGLIVGLIITISILFTIVAVIYNFSILPYQQQLQEQHREAFIVCNSDHIAENITAYCIGQNAINTTLWSERHK